MPKNANKMGSIRRRKDGRWEGRYTTPDGKHKSVYGATQREVADALRKVQHEMDSGSWLEPSRMTMDEWFTIWLRDHQSHTTGRTVQTYAAVIDKHMRPLFGDVKLADMRLMHVRRLVSHLTELGRASTTIRHAVAILSAALNSAVEDRLIKSNPAQDVKLKRARKAVEFAVIDRDQLPAFVEAVKATPCPDAIMFLLLTGVRLGEMRGLCWSDVDLNAGTINIRRQLYAQSRQVAEFRQPKNGEVREIHVGREVVELLRRHRREQLADRLRAGDQWHETEITADLVFRAPDGMPYSDGTMRAAMLKLRDAMHMPTLRLHDLRHSYAIAALRSGVDIKTVQHNLGHKHATITLDIYAAYTDDAGKAAAERLSAYFSDAVK